MLESCNDIMGFRYVNANNDELMFKIIPDTDCIDVNAMLSKESGHIYTVNLKIGHIDLRGVDKEKLDHIDDWLTKSLLTKEYIS